MTPLEANPLVPTPDDLDVDLEAYLVWCGWVAQKVARAAIRRALFAERTLADHVALYTETALRLRGVEDERDKLLAERGALAAHIQELQDECYRLLVERGALAARVEELEAALAAKGDGHGTERR